MMRSLVFSISAALLVVASPAKAATSVGESCAVYTTATEPSAAGAASLIPDALLANWRLAVSCIVPMIGTMNDRMKRTPLPADTRSKFLSATGGLRAIVTKISSAEQADGLLPDDRRDKGIEKLSDLATAFRRFANFDVTSALTFGARSDSYDVRLNSVLLLSNFFDERHACIPIIQLYDPALDANDFGINGRANLIAVLYRVAPWAYFEDYKAIVATKEFLRRKVQQSDPKLASTNKLLDGIDGRLALQSDRSNKSVHLPDALKESCRSYAKTFPAVDEAKQNLKYD